MSNQGNVSRRVSIMEAKLHAANAILHAALVDEERVALLHDIGYSGSITSIAAKIKRDTVMFSGAQNELERARKDGSEEGMTETDFTHWVVSVSKFMGYRIDKRKVTVAEFLEMNRDWEENVRIKNKQKK